MGITNRTANLITISKMSYQTEQRGSLYGDDFRMYFKDTAGNVVSPMHDIPLKAADNVYNMVVEVPRWSNAKLEISLGEKMNPVKQDIKKGKLRFVANCFPHHGYIWNYGALPQTWEDPTHMDPDTQANGDSDPVDICDIGSKVHEIGSIVPVKILGTFAMIDEGETDWKLIAIDVTDPMADKLNDIKDVEEHMPGLLAATVEWFKYIKCLMVSQLTHLPLIQKQKMQHLPKVSLINSILNGKDSCLELDTKELIDPVQATIAPLKSQK